MYRTSLVLLALVLSGCAGHPVLRGALIATGVAIVAGSAHESQSYQRPDQQVPGDPCRVNPNVCR
jgi:hypothetical protein